MNIIILTIYNYCNQLFHPVFWNPKIKLFIDTCIFPYLHCQCCVVYNWEHFLNCITDDTVPELLLMMIIIRINSTTVIMIRGTPSILVHLNWLLGGKNFTYLVPTFPISSITKSTTNATTTSTTSTTSTSTTTTKAGTNYYVLLMIQFLNYCLWWL